MCARVNVCIIMEYCMSRYGMLCMNAMEYCMYGNHTYESKWKIMEYCMCGIRTYERTWKAMEYCTHEIHTYERM